MTSKEMRKKESFLRNKYSGNDEWGLPFIKRQDIDLQNLELISYSDVKSNDIYDNRKKGVHFFVDDYRFEKIYDNPDKTLPKLSQYRFLLTPDYSLYSEMPPWKQIENIAKNRWCGAYWQEKGLTVIPTISWGLSSTFDFCFNGIEKNSIIAIGMIGCRKYHHNFICGYNEMLKRIEPQTILCFGQPFTDMKGNIIVVNYESTRKFVKKNGR